MTIVFLVFSDRSFCGQKCNVLRLCSDCRSKGCLLGDVNVYMHLEVHWPPIDLFFHWNSTLPSPDPDKNLFF